MIVPFVLILVWFAPHSCVCGTGLACECGAPHALSVPWPSLAPAYRLGVVEVDHEPVDRCLLAPD